VIIFDLGFLGVQKDFPEQKSFLPIKRKKNQTLKEVEEEYKKYSNRRMLVEHTICRIKKYRIMNYVFRNRLRKYDRISDIVSGLLNYRIMNSLG
jgi:hypothetical protein